MSRWLALTRAREFAALGRRARRAYAAMHAEAERKVITCARCGRADAWKGWQEAQRAGWVWEWVRGRAVFLCPDKHEERAAKRVRKVVQAGSTAAAAPRRRA